jgi:VIT1/CCC1 family predicted Fe2+/Mn2+ transporter
VTVTVIGGRISYMELTMNGPDYDYCYDPVTGAKVSASAGIGNSVFRVNYPGETFNLTAYSVSGTSQEITFSVTLELATLPAAETEPEKQDVPDGERTDDDGLEKRLEEADALIEKIGTVSIRSRDAIEAARAAVNAFSEEEQRGLKNLFVLDAAEKAFAEIEKKIADADTLIEKIGDDISLGSEKDIEAARAAVDALSEDEKNELKNLTKLRSAEDIFKVLKEAADKEASEDARKKEILSYIAAGAVIVIMIALIIFINVRKAKKQQ